MKLSDKIADMRRFAPLLKRRTSAVRVLRDIDDAGCVEVGADAGELVSFREGEAGFDMTRAAVVRQIEDANESLRAAGIEVDLSDEATGEGNDEEPEDYDEGEAVGDEVPA